MELVSMNWVAVLCGMSILDEVLSDSNRYANETLYSSNATIYSMAFSEDNKFLASSSSTGTIHIFRLPTEEEKLAKKTMSFENFFILISLSMSLRAQNNVGTLFTPIRWIAHGLISIIHAPTSEALRRDRNFAAVHVPLTTAHTVIGFYQLVDKTSRERWFCFFHFRFYFTDRIVMISDPIQLYYCLLQHTMAHTKHMKLTRAKVASVNKSSVTIISIWSELTFQLKEIITLNVSKIRKRFSSSMNSSDFLKYWKFLFSGNQAMRTSTQSNDLKSELTTSNIDWTIKFFSNFFL